MGLEEPRVGGEASNRWNRKKSREKGGSPCSCSLQVAVIRHLVSKPPRGSRSLCLPGCRPAWCRCVTRCAERANMALGRREGKKVGK